MGTYDTTFIVNPQTDDATIDKGVQSVSDLITENGGKIIHQDRIGTRRLAYPIRGLNQGYYTTVIFEGPSQILPVLNRHFKLNEIFMRHLTILYEEDTQAFTEKAKARVSVEEEPEDLRTKARAATVTDDEHSWIETDDQTEDFEEELPEEIEEKTDLGPSKPTDYEDEEEL